MKKEVILMGNEAIALGIVESGCSVAASYPGTPASEILESVARYKTELGVRMHAEWSVNEKSAFEVALACSYTGGRAAVSMKQVGLNVALDPLMSSAYTGVIGGLLVVSADDPGPHSSQTEQDSRFMAMFAKIPVLDPVSPLEAHAMVADAFEMSEKYGVPVMLRPTTRVCHARQNVAPGKISKLKRKAVFSRDPSRWAATPKYRLKLHGELNAKIATISRQKKFQPAFKTPAKKSQRCCIISSGVAYAYCLDLLDDLRLHGRVALCKVPMPYPLSDSFLKLITGKFERILVIEETYPVIELQIPDRRNVCGRLSGDVPAQGELTPDVLSTVVKKFLHIPAKDLGPAREGGQRPSLCPGCPHRASYFAIKKALPKAVYPGDIGCYTLGVNLGAVDTCLCMGAAVNQAAGFYHAFTATGSEGRSIVATIGDSTFLHSGITALINASYNGARFVLVILDNSTTAMTGNQPTAVTGLRADGTQGAGLNLEALVRGCGIQYVQQIDPYDLPASIAALKDADAYTRSHEGGIAVVISRRPCLIGARPQLKATAVITDACTGCRYCMTSFECPAIFSADDRIRINPAQCTGCGVCLHVCPVAAISMKAHAQEKRS